VWRPTYYEIPEFDIPKCCKIGFGRFVRIFVEDQQIDRKGTIISNVQQNRVVCKPEASFVPRK
jgi:hypothetical protein